MPEEEAGENCASAASAFTLKSTQKRQSQNSGQSAPSLRKVDGSHQTRLSQVLRVGDIMRILRNLVDHVILVVGPPTLNAVIQTKDGISVDVWTVPTLEAATNLDHCDVTAMHLVVDPTDGNQVKIIAQSDPADVGQWEPVAVFLSPFPASDVDQDLFAKCVDKVVQHKQVWSKATAVNAVTKSALIERAEYPDDETKAALVAKLKTYWESDPICTTMPIRVWQMYIVKSNKGKPQDAADKILEVIPAKCDRALPSELWDILEHTGAWVEIRQANFHTTANEEAPKETGDLELNQKPEHMQTKATVITVSSLEKKEKSGCGCFPLRSKKSTKSSNAL